VFVLQKCSRERATILRYTYVACIVKHVNNFLVRVPVKLAITAACITLKLVEGCIKCREGVAPQPLALFDSMDIHVHHHKTRQIDYDI
jgi:hypothetical protein